MATAAHGVTPGGYAQVVTFDLSSEGGQLAFVSGQVAMDDSGNIIGEGDFEAQCRAVFDGLARRLDDLGAALVDICKVTVFLRDFNHYSTLVDLRKHYFGTTSPPASSAVSVSGLVDDRLLVEIEAVAMIPASGGGG